MTQPAARTHGDLLVALAEHVTALTRPSKTVEWVDHLEEVRSSSGRRRKSRRVRTRHVIETPSLLDALLEAAMPGNDQGLTDGGGSGSFESRPPVELDAISVYRAIHDEAMWWARKQLKITERDDLTGLIRALVSARYDSDVQLAQVVAAAGRWVRDARLAVKWDAAPLVLPHPCPLCGARNSVRVFGLGQVEQATRRAKCGRCGTAWSHDQLGLFAQLLEANRTQETMTR